MRIRGSLSALALLALSGIGTAQTTVTIVELLDTEKIESLVFERINAERTQRGLQSLKRHGDLAMLARTHSGNMVRHNFFSHRDHEGMNPQQRCARYFPRLVAAVGENIASHYGASPEEVAGSLMTGWMNSPGHRANILSGKYSHVGVGVVQKDLHFYATQAFGELFASLESDVPGSVEFGSEIALRFRYEGAFPRERLTVFTTFPDRNARFFLPNGSFYTGSAPLTPLWDGDFFTVKLKLDRGRGRYTINFGKDGRYYPDGVVVLAP